MKAKLALINILRKPKADYSNKILLYKFILQLVLLYVCPIWAFKCNTSNNKLLTLQNSSLWKIGERRRGSPWYLCNRSIANDFKIKSIRKTIQETATNFFNKLDFTDNNLINILPSYDSHQFKFRKRLGCSLIISDLYDK